MNLEETGALLRQISDIDKRKPDPGATRLWHKLVGHLDYHDAHEAALRHFGTSDAYLMPIHIITGVRRIRADRLERTITAPPPAEIADDAAAARRWMGRQVAAIADGRHVNRALGLPAGQRRPGPPPQEFQRARGALTPDDDTTTDVRQAALRISCPHCRARPGEPCTLSGTKSPLLGRPAHDARIEAAARS